MNLVIHIIKKRAGRSPVVLSSDRRVARRVSVIATALLVASPAWAQLSQVNTLLGTIQTTLLGVGGVICSISIIWAGFRMMFQHARFGDIANVFIGGLFVGCATVIAGMLIPTS
ncbi:TrbC/VirB2 family protein [Paraburkholderia phytofirmans]|uniref:Conjugal transfer protein TrbC n=1 Tax=Paraburkholderia phytofirmans (strain DSM 17436 / LMG 22146 / PsJN) TaxID=398527 RepID=B2TB70_PARPJ|nr:TrbC/VirB2 family protein [Paraburkholderia phytofirmans]ACD20812.1 Conjugal transfer protein TrbC [Paraburkholderia phytofirmans PsJN]